jgi:hypothetical protein
MSARRDIIAPLTLRQVSWRPLLRAVPHRNVAAEAEPQADGSVRITVPLRRPWWAVPPISWILQPSSTRKVQLDTLGAQLWAWCDGRTVEEMVDAFAARFHFTFHEARVAVTGLLKSLVQRGVLAIEQDTDAEHKPDRDDA